MEDNLYLQPFDPDKEFPTEERCHIIELLNNHTDAPYSIARARVEPQITTAWHLLNNTTEHYYILSGKGLMEIGNKEAFAVFPGDVVIIPAGLPQRITNVDFDEDLLFLAICSPAFTDENYEACE
jgi:mannose-6-phosphate isomerase-like protein (cupin superfamily)